AGASAELVLDTVEDLGDAVFGAAAKGHARCGVDGGEEAANGREVAAIKRDRASRAELLDEIAVDVLLEIVRLGQRLDGLAEIEGLPDDLIAGSAAQGARTSEIVREGLAVDPPALEVPAAQRFVRPVDEHGAARRAQRPEQRLGRAPPRIDEHVLAVSR